MTTVEMKRALRAATLGLIFGLFSLHATAQAPVDDPGYVDFGAVSSLLGQAPEVNINFGSAMLSVFAQGMRESDSTLADLLGGLRGLRVMVFENVSGPVAREYAEATALELAATGWEQALTVRETDTNVDLFLRSANDEIRGLAIMVTETDGSAVFINVVGRLDPATLGRLLSGSGVNLDSLGALAEQMGLKSQ